MWEQIRSNRIRSIVLLVLMAAVLMALGYVIGLAFVDSPITGLIIALAVWGIMALVSYFQGDSILLSLSSAKKIKKEDYPRLYNVVEEMKIASGLEKMPDIYIIDDKALNAFATGRSPEKASVAITSGLLERLNRDELQGVIGHELSHIKNRDVLLMSIAGIMLGTIVILGWYASRILIFGGAGRSRRSSSSGGGQGQIIVLLLGLVFMILAPIMAQLLYFAVSRKREYLADASSALYTRYPEGLASALEKLGGSTVAVKNANKATAPMYIVNPFRSGNRSLNASELTSTHPPLGERIKILRAMAGGASLADYEKAYEQVKGKRGTLIPATALAGAGAVGLRGASDEPGAAGDVAASVQRRREVSDALNQASGYRTVTCECGTKWKVPMNFRDDKILCTRCGRTVDVTPM